MLNITFKPKTLVSILQNLGGNRPACIFLEDGEHETARITYGELDKKARVIAAYLQNKNLIGQRVLLLYPAGIDFVTAFVGCLYAGVVAVPIYAPRLAEFERSQEFIDTIIDDARVAGIFTTDAYLAKTESLCKEKAEHSKLFVADTTSFDSVNHVKYVLPNISNEMTAYLQYTSGSTSSPKAVVIQHQQLIHNLKYTSKAWHYGKGSVMLTWAPHSHVYGLVCGLLVPLYQGGVAVIMPPDTFVQKPLRWLAAITKYKVTHSGCPNFGYDLCVQGISQHELAGLNLKSWKVAINGGENVQQDTLIKFSQKFAPCGFRKKHFCSAYGMSELSGTVSVSQYGKEAQQCNVTMDALSQNSVIKDDANSFQRKFVSSGELIPGLQAIIVDPDTRTQVKKGKIGEIWLSGKSVGSGYWGHSEETKEVFGVTLAGSKQTYFRTGDLGFVRNNEIFLTGRLKELLVIYGKKYYPLDIEKTASKALETFPVANNKAVFTAFVEGKDRVIFLQEMIGDVSIAMGDSVIQAIRSAITRRHGIDIYSVVLVAANSLPKTPSGKLQRKLCQKAFLEDKLQVVHSHFKKVIQPKDSAIISKQFQSDFLSIISAVLNINKTEINIRDSLSVYGFDSINMVALAARINETYHLAITPAILFEYTTLEEFINDLLSKHKNIINAHYESTIQHNQATSSTLKTAEKKSPQFVDKENVLPKKMNDSSKDIAIIGMSGVFPGASDVNALWENLVSGNDAISDIPKERWDWEAYYGDSLLELNKTKIKWGGFIEDIAHFDASFFTISPREAELTDPQQRIFLQVVWKAIEDAGYATEELSQLNTGLYVGVFNNDYAELLQKNGISDAYTTTGLTHAILANRVSYLLNLHGPSEAIDTACSSSLVALHHAVQAIHNKDCSIAIVGGVNALLSPTSYLAASKAGMLSADGRCKTFDKKANGYVRGEGAAAIVLKPLSQARVDGDHIYGVIKGTAVNHGGHVSSLTVPNPIAQADVIVSACQRAGITADALSYIETHGTGTSLGDPIEINGLKKAFSILKNGKNEGASGHNYCGLGSIKTHIGHLEAAAGIASVVKVLLAMQHEKIPGNLHFEELNDYIKLTDSPFYIADKTSSWSRLKDHAGNEIPRIAGVSSFGFGGTNAHVIIEEFSQQGVQNDLGENDYPYLVTLSAKTDIALKQRITDLQNYIEKSEDKLSLAAISYTLNAGRNHFDKRCAFVVKSVSELKEILDEVARGREPDNFIINTASKTTLKRKHVFEALLNQITAEVHADTKLSVVDYHNKLLVLGDFYTEGHNLDWKQIHRGKVQRMALPSYPFAKEYYWIPDTNILPAKINNVTTSEETKLQKIQRELMQHVSTLLKIEPHNINLANSLSDLGFDSIAFKELAVRLENHYDIDLNPSIFFTHNSIQALSQYFLETYAMGLVKRTDTDVISTVHATNEPIAIIGIQALLPQSKNLDEFWEHLVAGDDLVTEVPLTRWDWREYYGDAKLDTTKTNSKWGAFLTDVDQFDAGFFKISSREANLMDPQHRLFMEVVWKTIEDAGYDPFALAGKDVGLFAGVEFSEYQTLMSSKEKNYRGHVATGNSHAMLANRISYFLDLHGPSEVIDTACSSSLVAIHRAVSAIHNGECTVAIAGGVSLMLNPDTFVITSQLGALSSDGRCKTFDKSANGYVKGEGSAAVFLKPLSQAEKDGDHIYGVIKASVVNHGGKAQSLTAPNASVQSQLLLKAYTQAGIDPETVTYIETHGTGTELGDPIEIEGLKQAFSLLRQNSHKKTQRKSYCGLGSVKTNIGHLEPASGVVGVIKVLLAMKHAKLPGNLHFNELNPYIDLSNSPFYIVEKTKIWGRLEEENGSVIPHRAGVSSFGFGGTNAHIVLEERLVNYEMVPAHAKSNYLITISAKLEPSLKQKMVDLRDWLRAQTTEVSLEALSFTLNRGRAHFDYRCALVVSSVDELIHSLTDLIEGKPVDNCISGISESASDKDPVSTEMMKSTLDSLKKSVDMKSSVYREKLLMLADLYTKNYPIDWEVVHAGEKHQRLASLPSYPFIKERYWFDAEIQSNQSLSFPRRREPIQMDSRLRGNDREVENFTLRFLQSIFAEKLALSPDKISINETYEVYGVDSLLGLEIINRLEADFGTLPKTLLYERTKISDLAKYFQNKHKNTLLNLYHNSDSSQTLVCHPERSEGSGSVNTSANEILRVTQDDKNKIGETNTDIAIIGLSGTYPMANDINEFWANLAAGKDCVGEIPPERWNYKDYPINVGGKEKYFKNGGFIVDVDKFDPLFFNIAPREAALMDPQERLFLQSAWSTIEDAGYTRERLQATVNNEVGVFVGVTYNFYPLFIAEEWVKGNRLPLDIQLFSVANRVSYFLNLKGPSFVVDTACSSSLAAIHLACESILRGECSMAIAGGVNLSLHPAKYHMLGSYSFLSDTGRCTSFAEGGTGYVPAEGVGSVLLKPLALAIRDNDIIYGVIKGSSMNHGGKTSGYTVPNPNAQSELITSALEKSNIDPKTISYIEAHGTGTALGDPIEIRGLQESFELYTDEKQFCAIGSVKSSIGHAESAAGISQLTKVLLQMRHKKLVPSLHAEKTNPFIDFLQTPFFVQKTLENWLPANNYPRRAGISSFGAGGANIHLIVEEFVEPTMDPKNQADQNALVFVLSAMNAERLHEYAKQMYLYLTSKENTDLNIQNFCYTLQVGRESLSARLAIIAMTRDDLVNKIKTYLDTPDQLANQIWVNHNVDIHRTTNENHGQLAEQWVNGSRVIWDEMYGENKPRRISIPTYPFLKRRCWVSSQAPSVEVKKADHWLIMSDKELGFILKGVLSKTNCSYCFAGEKFDELNDNVFYIDPKNSEDYDRLISVILSKNNETIRGIIYLWQSDRDVINQLLQSLINKNLANKLQFGLVTRSNNGVDEQLSFIKNTCNLRYLNLDVKKNLREDAIKISNLMQNWQSEVASPVMPETVKEVIQDIKKNLSVTLNRDEVVMFVVTTLAELLDLDIVEIDLEVAFLNYGLDSISGINFVAKLNEQYANALSPMDLYRYPTVNQLVGFIIESCQSIVEEVQVADTNNQSLDSESQFLEDISHLSDEEVSKLLEDELSGLDKLF